MTMRANELDLIRTFLRVVERGSFSAVAREAGIGQPAVSKKIAALESQLGVQLVRRSSNHQTLTEVGQELYDAMVRVVDELDTVRARVGTEQVVPSGIVRVMVPPFFGRRYVVPHLPTFFERYPGISIDLRASERTPNLVEEGLDLAIHTGELEDSAAIARKIASTSLVTVASAAYIAKHGRPSNPAELANHPCVIFAPFGAPIPWRFRTDAGLVRHFPTGNLRANDAEHIRSAVLSGIGLGFAPAWLFSREIATNVVKSVLRRFAPPPLPISAVHPAGRHVPTRVRLFVEFLSKVFKDELWFARGTAKDGAA
jgi:DNA-binding transcriptional LysR family regulator